MENLAPTLSETLRRAHSAYTAGKLVEAEELCRQLIGATPDLFDALYLYAVIQSRFGNKDAALAGYDRALAVRPGSAEALSNRGLTLHELKRFEEALASYGRALAVRPDIAVVHYNRANTLKELKRFAEALASYDSAVALRPDYAAALFNRGNTLHDRKRFEEALASYGRTLAVWPDAPEVLSNRGITLRELKRFDEALASHDRALAVRPDLAEAHFNRGLILQELKRFEEAVASYDRALAVNPCHRGALGGIAYCVNRVCDWRLMTEVAGKVTAHVHENKSIIPPFTLLGYSGDPSLQLRCAQTFVAERVPSLQPPLCAGTTWLHGKVRIAYLSADFHSHATAHLMAELFERHDRSRFEIVGVSFGIDDQSEMRSRLVAAFDQFHDVCLTSDEEAAKLVYDLQADIAIDLKGHTQDSRLGILAYRPAPIQASYLGFPGTMGAEFIDYIIADKTVAPFEHQLFYTEKIVHLPDCYQVNDTRRTIAERTTTRQEAGLPEKGFVFCCFNANWKITPDVFSVWMRLLRAVEGSILWLMSDNKSAESNLRREAQARGIDPTRLVFASRLPLEEHLARHRLADLFLDTLPYNAHTTASDALRAGLPVVTRLGESFAGRVGASLVNAIGLAELVTHSIEDYEALALRLAKEPPLLEGYRNRLASNRLTHPLFDTDRFRRHIEAAYLQMWEIWQRREAPRSFAIETVEAIEAAREHEAHGFHDRTLGVRPDSAEALCDRGVALQAQKRFAEALAIYDRALAVRPHYVAALSNRGLALHELKRFQEALASYDRALAVRPDLAAVLFNRGNTLKELKRFDDALESYDRALAVRPNYAAALFNRGNTLHERKRFAEALASYNRALAVRPDCAEALTNRGVTLKELKLFEEALASHDRALAVRPDFAEAHSHRGLILHELKRFEEALASYDRALAVRPDYAEAYFNRGITLRELGRFEEAVTSYERAIALKPDFGEAQFALCMAELPILYTHEPEIVVRRAAYERRLRALCEAGDRSTNPADFAKGVGLSQPFFLAYQGHNDRDLQAVYGAFVCRLMARCYAAAAPVSPPGEAEPVRVGIVSGFFRQHSNWRLPIKGWLSQLDRRRFRIFGYHTGVSHGVETTAAAALCERFVQGPLPVDGWRAEILADAPHVLIYPEIGMDAVAASLAAQRLAAVQCNSWGHPETSGFPTIDYYLSSDLMEPPDGRGHYTERLVRLPNLSVYCEPIEPPEVSIDRKELGLRDTAIVYWCGQSLYKYLPQFDEVFVRIARAAGDCQFAFIQYHQGEHITELFRRRLDRAFSAFGLKADDYCRVLPRLDERTSIAACGQCDIFLDSINWSGCNSTIESLVHDLPIVTMAGPLMRGRHSMAILRMMDVTETLAETIDDYVSIAVRLAKDVPWRTAVKANISASKHRIYFDIECISGLERFLNQVARTNAPK